MSAQDGKSAAAETVALAWQRVLSLEEDLLAPEIARAAYAEPRLRELFPLVSHGALTLSRCTRSPWSNDVPTLYRRAGGGYVVIRYGEGRLGEPDTVEEAVALIVANLPAGCGAAVDGTADDLD
ncbi:hypothetical protein BLA24_31900 [Streptomyces cinnamoneus]|uniref:Uncharacterized protein n=1 Tax=Streptomyces cinnamoneus TaxID=53446 RepID=A0A2G1X9Z8_STRCJ|nr:DUF6193 family natural product biosynthesis protein [Streptomyces cinnamoneus]PHQ48056.1 hypothetical protein BLA24_31900 [Streptomyces cinnamoneus]PPT15682.1 hypothetical protein CYQ11_24955 [Streptomyces cinnamoneus]